MGYFYDAVIKTERIYYSKDTNFIQIPIEGVILEAKSERIRDDNDDVQKDIKELTPG